MLNLYYRGAARYWRTWRSCQEDEEEILRQYSYISAPDRRTYEFCAAPFGMESQPTEYPPSPLDIADHDIVFYWPAGTDSERVDCRAQLNPISPEQQLKDTTQGTKMIDVSIKRDAGKLMLVVNAKDFHAELDKIGCAHENGLYLHRPATNVSVASGRFEMSTECLLKREYPAKFDLTGLWSTIPTSSQLNSLCESAYSAGRKILDHYQPIDINISIQKKLLK